MTRHKHVRLRDFSYASDSTYFVTQVSEGRQNFFGEVVDGEMYLTRLGMQAWIEWDRSLQLRPDIVEHAFIVMPNHLHLLFSIDSTRANPQRSHRNATLHNANPVASDVGAALHNDGPVESHGDATPTRLKREPRSVSSLMGNYKGALTRWVRAELRDPHFHLWQAGFHEHVVRSEKRFDAIYEYIHDNPARWDSDKENPERRIG